MRSNRIALVFLGTLMSCVILVPASQARPRATPTPPTTSSRHSTARLIVQRAPNFGTNLSIRLLIDGKKVSDVPRNQHYGGVLTTGRHVITALSLPNTQLRRPTSIALTLKAGQVYIFTAGWDGDRLVLRPSNFYMPTVRANRS